MFKVEKYVIHYSNNLTNICIFTVTCNNSKEHYNELIKNLQVVSYNTL